MSLVRMFDLLILFCRRRIAGYVSLMNSLAWWNCTRHVDGHGRTGPLLDELFFAEMPVHRLLDHLHASEIRKVNIRLERSEERRVGKECRSGWSPYHYKRKKIGM